MSGTWNGGESPHSGRSRAGEPRTQSEVGTEATTGVRRNGCEKEKQ